MRFKALWKDTFRELSKSIMRFLAILIIILLGVGFYVGISATGPNMIETIDQYYSDLNLMDYRIVSTYGLTENDLQKLKENDKFRVQSHYANDFIIEDFAQTIRLYSLDVDHQQNINQYELVEGRLPEKENEIALDKNDSFLEDVQLGDEISLEESKDAGEPKENLIRTSFEVVGFVNSPLFIENISRGTSSVGNGTLDGFGVISEEVYDAKYKTDAYLTLNNKKSSSTYSNYYKDLIDENEVHLKKTLNHLEDTRITEIENEIQDEIDDGQTDIEEAKQEIKDAKDKLKKAENELNDGWNEFEKEKENFDQEITSAQQEINQNEKNLKQAQLDSKNKKEKLIAQKQELKKQTKDLEANEPELNDGIKQVEEGIKEIDEGLQPIELTETYLNDILNDIKNNQYDLTTLKSIIETVLTEADVDEQERQEIKEKMNEAIENIEEDEEVKKQITNELESLISRSLERMNEEKQPVLKQRQELVAKRDELYQQREQLVSGKEELEAGIVEIRNGLAQIENGQKEINEGLIELENAQATLNQEKKDGQRQLDEAEQELEEGQEEYEKNLAKFESEQKKAQKEIKDAEKDLEKAEKDLKNLTPPEYHLFDRADNQGYSEFEDNAERLAIIAKVFPVFFFLIAIFISFTTMTRMVDEEREYIGIMKAMGYANRHILIKFITYALLATTLGAILGLTIGYTLLPELIFFAYSPLYNLPSILLRQHTLYTVIALSAAYLSTVGASLIATYQSLKSNAATLLQPKAPKKGSRIWLEKISFIWKKLSFNQKITFRNVFRYKARMLMTIFGIAGSTGLILTGFGISDSIRDIPDIQYGEINKFQAYVALDANLDEDELFDIQEEINDFSEIDDELTVRQENATTNSKEITKQELTILVPKNPNDIDDFISLRDYSNSHVHKLDDSGAQITQKLAQLLDIRLGDTIEVSNSDDEVWTIEIVDIIENYIGHTLYMTPSYYEEVTNNDDVTFNTQLIKYDEEKIDVEKLGKDLIDKDEVIGINYVSEIHDAFSDTLHSLDLITQILIVSAAALAFIVLYNLTNINVSERQRELSTIKVLGSYDYEVTMYIYRENIILTAIGILVGFGFGSVLTNFIMSTMEVDMLVFGREIHFISYIYSGLFTIIFTLIVMLVIHFQLKRIDMVEALKTND